MKAFGVMAVKIVKSIGIWPVSFFRVTAMISPIWLFDGFKADAAENERNRIRANPDSGGLVFFQPDGITEESWEEYDVIVVSIH